jgi:hypothetical protein
MRMSSMHAPRTTAREVQLARPVANADLPSAGLAARSLLVDTRLFVGDSLPRKRLS